MPVRPHTTRREAANGNNQKILAFDYGERRIGVAIANVPPRIAAPLMTLEQNDQLRSALKQLIADELPDAIVVGRPRNQSGGTTPQTEAVEAWARDCLSQWQVPIFWQDESLTSVAAEAHLQQSRKPFRKEDIDAYAAAIILTDFLEANKLQDIL